MIDKIKQHAQIIKYIISGGSSAAVTIVALFLFTHFLNNGVYKVRYSVGAFIIAFCVSFTLQKFWTFKDRSTERVHGQLSLYLLVALLNLGLTSLLMYIFVNVFHVHYIISQIIVSGGIAFATYSIYKKFIFKH